MSLELELAALAALQDAQDMMDRADELLRRAEMAARSAGLAPTRSRSTRCALAGGPRGACRVRCRARGPAGYLGPLDSELAPDRSHHRRTGQAAVAEVLLSAQPADCALRASPSRVSSPAAACPAPIAARLFPEPRTNRRRRPASRNEAILTTSVEKTTIRGRVVRTVEEAMGMTYRTREEVAQRVRELRDERGLSQRKLAEAIGVDPASMNRIESGQRGISTGELVAIAEALQVDVDIILRVEEPSFALRANCGDDEVRESLEFFRDVIADFFAVEALAR
jgi:transcriptional regulator with XRE-family HTH domain